ncbi:MAG: tetratricopeptide repeat protein [Candidatus Fervidibacter sp.]|uniref:tetratricopeptide repeat protein n=1 Tax=Candidatus Fervidibacter sp. TaxID=3100871 RepID=UPI00404B6387
MDWAERLSQIRNDLDRLARFPTVNEILIRYLYVVYEHLEKCSPYAQSLPIAFEALVNYELWHHKALTKLAGSQELQMRYLVPLGVEMRNALLQLTRKLERMPAHSPDEIVVRELLKAHCYYQLGELEATVNCLEEAIKHGATHPLIYFVLGYNRHRYAITEYARWEPVGQQLIVTDKDAFERILRKALEDFRNGLSYSGNEPMDARLYFWMGMVYEILGERDEAMSAYRKAQEVDPETYGGEVERRLQHITKTLEPSNHTSQPPPPPAELQEEQTSIKPISEAELDSFRKALSEIETISDLLRRMGGHSKGKGPSEGN